MLNRFINALLIGAALFAVANVAFGLDAVEPVAAWTPHGKRLAMERVKLATKDEMVVVPAGWFVMGSNKKVDRNA